MLSNSSYTYDLCIYQLAVSLFDITRRLFRLYVNTSCVAKMSWLNLGAMLIRNRAWISLLLSVSSIAAYFSTGVAVCKTVHQLLEPFMLVLVAVILGANLVEYLKQSTYEWQDSSTIVWL